MTIASLCLISHCAGPGRGAPAVSSAAAAGRGPGSPTSANCSTGTPGDGLPAAGSCAKVCQPYKFDVGMLQAEHFNSILQQDVLFTASLIYPA